MGLQFDICVFLFTNANEPNHSIQRILAAVQEQKNQAAGLQRKNSALEAMKFIYKILYYHIYGEDHSVEHIEERFDPVLPSILLNLVKPTKTQGKLFSDIIGWLFTSLKVELVEGHQKVGWEPFLQLSATAAAAAVAAANDAAL